jgi:hypothetical protein
VHAETGQSNELDIVGIKEIAERLRRKPQTVALWRHQNRLPEPDGTVSGAPAWHWGTIANWAAEHDRVDAVAVFSQITSGWRVVDGAPVKFEAGAVVREVSAPFPAALPDGTVQKRLRVLGAWDDQWYEITRADYNQATGEADRDTLINLLLGVAIVGVAIAIGAEAAKGGAG